MSEQKQRVVVVGASPKPERYSNRAVRRLLEYGHKVVPVNPSADLVEGLRVVADLGDVEGPVDTVTLYISAEISTSIEAAIVQLNPKRVIFNPGSENPTLSNVLAEHGIVTQEACTLVLLETGQF